MQKINHWKKQASQDLLEYGNNNPVIQPPLDICEHHETTNEPQLQV